MTEHIYEEVKDAAPLIQIVAQQTKPIFSSLKIYGTAQFPLYVASDIGYLLEVKNIDRLVRAYKPQECITAKIKTADPNSVERSTKLLTRHGMYRIMFDANSPVSEVFREFVYMVLDKLSDDGVVHLKTVQTEMQQQFSAELERATAYLQNKVHNLENEVIAASRITRRATELMHNKEQEAGRLSQESQQLQMKIYNLEKKLLAAELSDDSTEDEQFLEYMKTRYLKKYLVYLLPDHDDEYDYRSYDLTNPPDENDTMYYRITPRECKTGSLVKEIYFEADTQFAELKAKLFEQLSKNNPSLKASDILITDLYTITEIANNIRNRPVIERKREKRAEVEASLATLKQLWQRDCDI